MPSLSLSLYAYKVDGVEYLALEDLMQDYGSRLGRDLERAVPPSVMDIKIGRKTHGPWGAWRACHIRSFA